MSDHQKKNFFMCVFPESENVNCRFTFLHSLLHNGFPQGTAVIFLFRRNLGVQHWTRQAEVSTQSGKIHNILVKIDNVSEKHIKEAIYG